MHGGYQPEDHEVAAALSSVGQLEEFVKERLCSPVSLARYPRTAFILLSRFGLERRGLWSSRIERLVSDPTEPHWLGTFNRWMRVVRFTRLARDGVVDFDAVARSIPTYLLDASRSEQWLLHDIETGRVLPARLTKTIAEWPPPMVAEARARFDRTRPPMRLAWGMLEGVKAEPAGDAWDWAYKHLPGWEVFLGPPRYGS